MSRLKIAGALAAVCVVAVLLALVVPSTRWRVQLVALKAAGQVPTLAWNEVFFLLKPGARIWPQSLWEMRNPYWAIRAPNATAEDIKVGQAVFHQQCSGCHSEQAQAGSVSPLFSGRYKRGASDLALFLTIRGGVPGTEMKASALSPTAMWQVVAFLRDAVRKAYLDHPPVLPIGPMVGAAKLAMPPTVPSGKDGEWLTYHGGEDGQRHSRLAQIDRGTVSTLQVNWQFQLPVNGGPLEVTPLVAGERMFVNLPTGDVWALNARTGEVLWHHPGEAVPDDIQRSVDGVGSRGMALLEGRLFVPTLDASLMALDVRDGSLLWKMRVADYRKGYTITGAPLAAGDRIVVGVAGGDRGVRGFLDAYSPQDGRRLWRFETVPGPGQPGHETWGKSDAWRRGGGLTPVTGTYDPRSRLIYWGTGNPSPAFEGDIRHGDNLYTSSVIALEAGSGRLSWHYQVAPHDEWEWGVTHVPVLVGSQLFVASRNGFFYALDRNTGRFLRATAFAMQTWNDGFDSAGIPRELPHSRPTLQGTLIWPGHAGATGTIAPSCDADRGLFFVVTRDGYGNVYYKSPRLSWPDGAYWGGHADRIVEAISPAAPIEVKALSVGTGQVRWAYRFSGAKGEPGGGLLSTAGGLVFAAEQKRFVALDSDSGRELWRFDADEPMDAAPMSYLADGRQRIAIAAGRSILVFASPP